MKIRTSYFAQLKKINKIEGAVPIAVCQYPPKWYSGAIYKKVAPSYEMIQGMKCADTRDFFAIKYLEMLNNLDQQDVLKDIMEIVKSQNGSEAILLCFEKPTDFCHRHLLASWLGLDESAEMVFS